MSKSVRGTIETSDFYRKEDARWPEWNKLSYMAGSVHPVIDTQDLPDFGEWLSVPGYCHPEDGIRSFMAYKTKAKEIRLGLPAIPVYSPLPGKILRISEGLRDDVKSDIGKYFTYMVISHNRRDTIASALHHIEPCVEAGDFVEAGEQVGTIRVGKKPPIRHFPGNVSIRMDSAYHIEEGVSTSKIDPLAVLFPDEFAKVTEGTRNEVFESLILPKGDLDPEELRKRGIQIGPWAC